MSKNKHRIGRNDMVLGILNIFSLILIVITLSIFLLMMYSWPLGINIPNSLANTLFPLLFILPIPAFLTSVIVFFIKKQTRSARQLLSTVSLILSTLVFIGAMLLLMYASAWSSE